VLQPDFVSSVQRARANALCNAGRVEQACSVWDVVISAYRELCINTPTPYTELLAFSCNELGDALEALGRTRDALDVRKECLIKCSEMYRAGPSDASSKLALKVLKDVKRTMTRPDLVDNANNIDEIIDTPGEINGEIPTLFYNFAESQWKVAESLSFIGREEDAFVAAQESIFFNRTLFKMNECAFHDQLVEALWRLAEFLRLLHRADEAYVAAQESVFIYRDLLENGEAPFRGRLADALWRLAEFLRALDRRGEAFTAAQESVSVYRAL